MSYFKVNLDSKIGKKVNLTIGLNGALYKPFGSPEIDCTYAEGDTPQQALFNLGTKLVNNYKKYANTTESTPETPKETPADIPTHTNIRVKTFGSLSLGGLEGQIQGFLNVSVRVKRKGKDLKIFPIMISTSLSSYPVGLSVQHFALISYKL